MTDKAKRLFFGVFLIITPPALMLLSASISIEQERHVRDGRSGSAPFWDVVFPLALIACFVAIPLGVYVIYRALTTEV